jgi:hypothetical protein
MHQNVYNGKKEQNVNFAKQISTYNNLFMFFVGFAWLDYTGLTIITI